jgi:hypothetical protein
VILVPKPYLLLIRLGCFTLVCALPLTLQGQLETASHSDRATQAVRVPRSPRLDGTLDDPIWQTSRAITEFLQREPNEGRPPSERTEVHILYTEKEVYFGIACHDSAPKVIVATEMRRDVSQELDDYFEIIIDALHSRRNAYVFQINPLGTQRDALITEEQSTENGDGDSGWDGIWTSEARITESGWSATVAIPFSTLNFMRSRDLVWGINFKRFIPRKNEEDLWSGWRRVFGASKISQAGELHGISGVADKRLLIVKPYGLLGLQHQPPTASGTGLTPGTSGLYTGGLDLKVGLRSSLVANFTANTDFADADVDSEQFNLTPYKLFFPEKRQFFLENASIFSFPLGGDSGDLLFFSRQIGINPITGQEVPINAGAKITGSMGGFEIGLLDVETRQSRANPYANYALLRVKRALPGGSYIGLIGIDKRTGDPLDRFNTAIGADTRLAISRSLVATGYAAQTRTHPFTGGQFDVGAGLNYQSNWLDVFAQHRDVGHNFNPEVGFLERNDCICDYIHGQVKDRPDIRGVREVDIQGSMFHAPDTHHVLQTQEWLSTLVVKFRNGSVSDNDIADVVTQRLTAPFNIYKNVSIPAGIYHWTRHQLKYQSPTNRRLTVLLRERFGSYYGGSLNEAAISGTWRVNWRLSFDMTEQWSRFQLPVHGGNFSAAFGSFQTNYSFSRRLTLSTLIQVNTANTRAASGDIRLRWNYRPDSDLFVIYTAGQRFASLAATSPTEFTEHRFVLKYTYSWRL